LRKVGWDSRSFPIEFPLTGPMSDTTLDRYRGGILGLALGDALAAPSNRSTLSRLRRSALPRSITPERRWTAETRMALDLIGSLVTRRQLDQDDLADRFARNHRPDRGYSPRTAVVLKRIRSGWSWRVGLAPPKPEPPEWDSGVSCAVIAGLFRPDDRDALDDVSRGVALVLDADPISQESAVITARAIATAVRGGGAAEIFRAVEARARFASTLQPTADQPITPGSSAIAGTAICAPPATAGEASALDSCVTALSVALAHLDAPFEDLVRTAVAIGGEVQRTAALAGAVWGTVRGLSALPADELDALESRYDIECAARDLFDMASIGRCPTTPRPAFDIRESC
ncbi:MAG: ADP-ribosylglycohydrolase family protein, partial [Planctomycetota bacterium]